MSKELNSELSVNKAEIVEDAIRTGDPTKIYISHARHRLLSGDEELALGIRIQSGDTDARNTLINHNLRLVISLARKFAWSGIPLADLIQEGNLGLIRAAEKFDPKRGMRFTTYAIFWIRNKILKSLIKRFQIKLPKKIRKDLLAVAKAERKLFAHNGRDPSDQEIADVLEISPDRVRAVRRQFLVASLDVERGEDDHTLHDTIAENPHSDPVVERDRSRVVSRMLSVLTTDPKISEKKGSSCWP